MARGWESKSVESQVEDAAAVRPEPGHSLTPTPEERERTKKREGLEMSRRRVLQQIEDAQSDARRTSLRLGLTFLDEEIGKLGGSAAIPYQHKK